MRRGDIVRVADRTGDYAGKPRPALVVQSDLFAPSHDSITVCLITSNITGFGLFRIPVPADEATGLHAASEVAVDKLQSVRRSRIGGKIGVASDDTMILVDQALRRWLAL
jgi:mRNA interferase MazF